MTQNAQAIVMGRLSPDANCARIEPISFEVSVTPSEPGWEKCTFAFALNRDQLHVVVKYGHDDAVDRGHAVAKMRRTVRNLVDWFLLGQVLFSDSPLSFGREQAVARYLEDDAWISHLDPPPVATEQPPLPTTEHIFKGGAILSFITSDHLLLYALQDYSSAVANPDFALFLLWRSLEWILWEYDVAGAGRNPAFAPAEAALSLPEGWLSEIGNLAHNFARHARRRDQPPAALVEAAKKRVRTLILRHLAATHKYPDAQLLPLEADDLTGYGAPQ